MLKKLKSLYRDERGLTTVEWAVLAVIVAAGAVIAGNTIRSGVGTAATTVNNKLGNTVNNASNAANW